MFLKKLINKGINKGYEAEKCELCHLQFNSFKFDRIHKCRRCSKFICHTCGDFKEFVIDEEGTRSEVKQRVCKICKNDIDQIHQTLGRYNMKWDSNSFLAKEWLEKIRKTNQRDFQFQHFLNYFHKSGFRFQEQTQIIEKDVIRGRTDFSVFNYSMKEFFYTMQENVEDQHTTRLNIANVLYGVAARYDKVGYCQGMSGIAAFLLCFASEEAAYTIFCDLIENIFPGMFLERNSYGVPLIGLLAQIHFLKEYYWIFVFGKKPLLEKQMQNWFTQQQEQHTKMVIELAGTKALLSVFIGVLNFTNLIFVWEELKTHRSFQVVEKAFLAIIYLNRYNIIQERSFKRLEEYFEKLDSESFKETYHQIEIDQQMRKKLTAEFYEQNKSKWSTSKTGNAYTLSKVTNLSETEIKMLQKFFCSGFSNQDFVSKSVINEEQFLRLIEIYYKVLKNNTEQGEPILQMTPLIIRKIFRQYSTKPQEGLIFRQFILCFSICTKSILKERIVTIASACDTHQEKVSYQNLTKIIESLTSKVPVVMEYLKASFFQRMKVYFSQKESISLAELSLLLNDLFINELNMFVRSSIEKIIELVVQEYKDTSSNKGGKGKQ